jgi:RHS repeat-associated protein
VPPTEPQGFDTIYSPHYGRVAYTHGLGSDQPLSIIRMGFGKETTPLDDFAVSVHTNFRGLVDELTSPSNGASRSSISGLFVDFPARTGRAFLEDRKTNEQELWVGNIVRQQRDASGQLYKRNRYYDPVNGRFTQEDPIGLAGGLNLYGFAGSEPVNNDDPFGLCDPQDPVCQSMGFRLLRFLGVSEARASAIMSPAVAGSRLIGPGTGVIVRGAGSRLGASAASRSTRALTPVPGADRQFGRKFGEHMDETRPGYRSHTEYRKLADRIYNDPAARVTKYPANSPSYAGETHYESGGNLLRLDPSGTFRSLYPIR